MSSVVLNNVFLKHFELLHPLMAFHIVPSDVPHDCVIEWQVEILVNKFFELPFGFFFVDIFTTGIVVGIKVAVELVCHLVGDVEERRCIVRRLVVLDDPDINYVFVIVIEIVTVLVVPFFGGEVYQILHGIELVALTMFFIRSETELYLFFILFHCLHYLISLISSILHSFDFGFVKSPELAGVSPECNPVFAGVIAFGDAVTPRQFREPVPAEAALFFDFNLTYLHHLSALRSPLPPLHQCFLCWFGYTLN